MFQAVTTKKYNTKQHFWRSSFKKMESLTLCPHKIVLGGLCYFQVEVLSQIINNNHCYLKLLSLIWNWQIAFSIQCSCKSLLSTTHQDRHFTSKTTFYFPTSLTLELREVIALFSSDSRSLRATGVAMFVSISTALAAAFSNDSDIVVG